MTAHESTNAHGDAHAAALDRTRKRAALAAWNSAVAAWRTAGEPQWAAACFTEDGGYRAACFSLPRVLVATPAAVAEGK